VRTKEVASFGCPFTKNFWAIAASSFAKRENQLSSSAIQEALDAHNGSIEQSARTLGMSRYVLSRLIRKHEFVVRKKPGS